MPADKSDRFPILMLECGVKALSLRKAQDAIRSKYGPHYHCHDEAMWEVAADLWGITPKRPPINRHGVFELFDDIVGLRAGRYEIIVKIAVAPNGLCAMSKSHRTALSGGCSPLSVWNPLAFFSLDDARTAGLAEHRKRFADMIKLGCGDISEAKAMLELIDDAATPQLELF